MGRHSSSSAYRFNCQMIYEDCYRISWCVDFYYRTSRLRFPRQFRRDTDEAGAKKFCKKHGIEMPVNTAKV